MSSDMIAGKMSIEFFRLKDVVKECFIAVGMVTDEKFTFCRRNLPAEVQINIVVGIHLPTSPTVLKVIKDTEGVNGRVYIKRFFHPKLYLFDTTEGWIAFVGSGNFTSGGWHENEELFIKVIDQETCKKLQDKYDYWFNESTDITDRFIEIYTQTYQSNLAKQKEIKANIAQLWDLSNNHFNIDNIDFSGQFFQKLHHQAFEPSKTHLETKDVLEERREVRNRLYLLNEGITTKMPKEWNLHPHYEVDHIVAHIENDFHHEYNVKGLWLAYGRNRQSLKQYGDWATPLLFMRMQVIVRYNKIGIWLMPGKQGAGQVDRENFARKMNEPKWRLSFFNMLSELGQPFWIEIAGEKRDVSSFHTPEELWEFTKNDRWRQYYFIVGKDFDLGDPKLKFGNITRTVLDVFALFNPIYNLIVDTSLVNS